MNVGEPLLQAAQKELFGRAYEGGSWKTWLTYSLCGRMALASLWDVDEEDEAGGGISSLQHFKKRVR